LALISSPDIPSPRLLTSKWSVRAPMIYGYLAQVLRPMYALDLCPANVGVTDGIPCDDRQFRVNWCEDGATGSASLSGAEVTVHSSTRTVATRRVTRFHEAWLAESPRRLPWPRKWRQGTPALGLRPCIHGGEVSNLNPKPQMRDPPGRVPRADEPSEMPLQPFTPIRAG
jgi:hypothetical protein